MWCEFYLQLGLCAIFIHSRGSTSQYFFVAVVTVERFMFLVGNSLDFDWKESGILLVKFDKHTDMSTNKRDIKYYRFHKNNIGKVFGFCSAST